MYSGLEKNRLLEIIRGWNHFLKRKVHLIACGGTAMTLMDVKASTKDVDFIIPRPNEYDYLTRQLKTLGYQPVTGSGWKRDGEEFQFDLFRGNRVHTTELLESPLEKDRHSVLINFRIFM